MHVAAGTETIPRHEWDVASGYFVKPQSCRSVPMTVETFHIRISARLALSAFDGQFGYHQLDFFVFLRFESIDATEREQLQYFNAERRLNRDKGTKPTECTNN